MRCLLLPVSARREQHNFIDLEMQNPNMLLVFPKSQRQLSTEKKLFCSIIPTPKLEVKHDAIIVWAFGQRGALKFGCISWP